jgi:hypothetical protein
MRKHSLSLAVLLVIIVQALGCSTDDRDSLGPDFDSATDSAEIIQSGAPDETNTEGASDSFTLPDMVPGRDAAIDAAKWRTWTAANGKYTLEAKFVSAAMGTLTLEKKDGSTIELKLDQLCSDDQDFVRKREWLPPPDIRSGPSAKVIRARLVPFINPDGERYTMVMVDWRNTGTTRIRAVDANIFAYAADGTISEWSRYDHPIYAVSDTEPGIGPGKTYKEPTGRGYILAPGFDAAARVEVTITEVVESGAY